MSILEEQPIPNWTIWNSPTLRNLNFPPTFKNIKLQQSMKIKDKWTQITIERHCSDKIAVSFTHYGVTTEKYSRANKFRYSEKPISHQKRRAWWRRTSCLLRSSWQYQGVHEQVTQYNNCNARSMKNVFILWIISFGGLIYYL